MSQTPASFSSPNKILVPLDFSDSSHAALATASEYGEKFHAEIEVLHVIATTPDFNGSDFFPNTSRLEEVRSESRDQVRVLYKRPAIEKNSDFMDYRGG